MIIVMTGAPLNPDTVGTGFLATVGSGYTVDPVNSDNVRNVGKDDRPISDITPKGDCIGWT